MRHRKAGTANRPDAFLTKRTMKKSGTTRTCPECGRTLETTINRFGVEMWPQHKYGSIYKDRSASWENNANREPGKRDWEVPCQNSAQPV